MKCKCGFENAEDAKFCGSCRAAFGQGPGKSVPNASSQSTAPHIKCKCGFENAPDAKFCGSCRAALGDGPGNAVPRAAAAPSPALPRPASAVVKGMPARHISRLGMLIVAAVVVVATAGYWWLNRPPGEYKPDNSGLFPINVSGKFGFMDRNGKTIITPQFDNATSFSEGLASVQVGTKWGYVNTKGLVVITPQFDQPSEFFEGRARARLGNKWGFIDENGKYVIAPVFIGASSFSQGLAQVYYPASFGSSGSEGTAYVDRSGKVAIPANAEYPSSNGDFHDGLAAAGGVNGKWGYIDLTGKWAITPQFDFAWGFADGLAPVQVSGRWGYIDQKGKFVVNPQYDYAREFHGGYAFFDSGGKFGFIDTEGRVIAEAKFLRADRFSDGLAAVQTEAGVGFIDPTGKMVISPQFDLAEPFQNGLARVTVLGKEAYITKTGAFVIDPFPGTTLKTMKEKMAAEAAQLREKSAGCWTGQFGDMAFAQVVIGTGGSVVVRVPVGQGWREALVGTLDIKAPWATLASANHANDEQYTATDLRLSAGSESLTGDLFKLNRGAVGRIALGRCLD